MREILELDFDMDGTIADLYGVDNWLPMLRAEDPTPYIEAEPLVDIAKLSTLLKQAQTVGIKVRIISWLSMDSSEEYKEQVRQAKKEWLEKHGFPYNNCNLVEYGYKKDYCVRNKKSMSGEYILFDDSENVRDSWQIGRTVNPQETDICSYIEGLLAGLDLL